MARPFWSGHIRISLVSFGIEMFPATEAKGEIHFHQLSRKTGERVHHLNVSSDNEPVDKDEIVKGYEYSKGQFVTIEPEDIDTLRIPSRETLEIVQFIDMDELDPKFFEKPYFVTPDGNAQLEAFTVVRKALGKTGKVGLGKIAFGGREHLMAIAAPVDESQRGIMAYVLRYAEELRDPGEYFGAIQEAKVDADQLSLAEELIKRKSASFNPAKFSDEYEQALRAMVEAKIKKVPQKAAPAEKPGKVINLMDALRKSVQGKEGGGAQVASTKVSSARVESPKPTSKKGAGQKPKVSKVTVMKKAKPQASTRKRLA
jgi:DNA end-binding protein Ku